MRNPTFHQLLPWCVTGALALVCSTIVADTPAPAATDLPALEALLELGSDFSSVDAAERQRVLALIDNRGRRLDLEREIVDALDQAAAETPYDTLVAAEGSTEADDLEAAQRSYRRYLAAEHALDRDAAARQLRAFQQYVALAADVIEQGLRRDDEELQRMSGQPGLRRRTSDDQAKFVATLRSSGLPAKSLDVLHAAGAADPEIAAYRQELLAKKPDEIGAGAAEFLAAIENARREITQRLRSLATAEPADLAGQSQQTFVVANPRNREEQVLLRVRRASIPPDWTVTIVNAREPDGGRPKYAVAEAEPGRRYTIKLPAHAQASVMAVVTPIGPIANDTIARWGIEGSIEGKLIGGMMMELRVPASIPPVALPPIRGATQGVPVADSTATQPEPQPQPQPPTPTPRSWRPFVAIGIGALLLLALLLAALRSRRKARPDEAAR